MAEGTTRFVLLGRFGIDRDGAAGVDARSLERTSQLAFAYLASEHRRSVGREELAAALWPDGWPDTWDAVLGGVLSDVRRFMESAGLDAADTLLIDRDEVRLRLPQDAALDIDEARAALARAFDLLAAGDATAAAEAAGRAAQATALPLKWHNGGGWADDLRSKLDEVHMRALDVQARALARAGSAQPVAAASRVSGAVLAPTSRGRPLLERERELAALESAIGDAVAGRARVAVVEGPAGIGKSRLVAEARWRAAEAGMRVLSAQGSELEQRFSFGVVRQLYERCLVGDGSRLLSGAAASARAIFDVAGGRQGGEAPGDPSFASLHGLYWLTVNLSDAAPLVIAVDDLHWCDRPSLRFVAYLRRRLEGLPVLLLGSARSSQPDDARAPLGEIADDPLIVAVRPSPLSAGAVADLVRERLGPAAHESFASACHTATGGNPLLLDELLKALEAERVQPDRAHVGLVAHLGPRAASRAVLLRLARLPPAARAVARTIAVLGDACDISTVAALAGLDEAQAAHATTALVRAEILRGEPPLGFVHPLVGAAIYGDVLPGERELQHERAARVLADAGAAVEKVAAHLLASPPRAEAAVVETLRTAARAATQKGGADSAVAYLARALAEPPPVGSRALVLLELGCAESLTSGPAAVEHLAEALERTDEPLARGSVALALARTLLFTGHADDCVALLRRTAAELAPEAEDLRLAMQSIELMAPLFGAGEVATSERLDRHRELMPDAGVGARMLAAATARQGAYAGASADASAQLALAALEGGELIAADNVFLSVAAILTLELADRPEAHDAWEALLQDALARGSLPSKAAISLFRGYALSRRGELADAEASLHGALEELKLWNLGAEGSVHHAAFLSAVLREGGDLAGARRWLEVVGDPGDASDAARHWLNSLAELLLAEQRFDAALAVSEDSERRFASLANPIDTPARSHRAVAAHHLGRRDEALVLAGGALEQARRWGAPATVARALRVLGTLLGPDGHEHLQEALTLVERSPARLEHAKALAALGMTLRRARRPSEARAPLQHALELADVCGATPLAQQVRSELYAAGARPRTSALTGVASLTPTEHRVASLAAAGQTNPGIAQALFVTPKTIEMHLSHAYRKLGVRSRKDLPAALV